MAHQRGVNLLDELLLPRGLNMLLGAWLAITSFLCRHSPSELLNSLSVGLLAVLLAAVARRREPFRYVNVLLALWLFVSAWTMSALGSPTLRNSVVVSIAMFLVALLPNVDLRARN